MQAVKVQAINGVGSSAWSSPTRMQSAGRPAPVNSLQVNPDPPADAGQTAAHLAWSATDPNGPALNHYTVNRRVAGGGWTVVARVSGGTSGFNDTVPYDGRRYEWMVTATNGGGSAGAEDPRFTSSAGNAAGFVATGVPQTPSVTASTPNPDYTATLTVQLGDPRSSSYSAIRWSSSDGGSGTHAYSGGPGTVTFRTSPLGVGGQSFTVRAVNAGGVLSAPARSNGVTVFGPTRTPTNLRSSVKGNTITWSWDLPTNGRPIDQVRVSGAVDQTYGSARQSVSFTGNAGQTYQLSVAAHSAAGWSGTAGPDRATIPNPAPSVFDVRKGPRTVAGRGTPGCTTYPGCPRVIFSWQDMPAGMYAHCQSENFGTVSPNNTLKGSSGNSETNWGGLCVFGTGVGRVRVFVNRSPGDESTDNISSAWIPWS